MPRRRPASRGHRRAARRTGNDSGASRQYSPPYRLRPAPGAVVSCAVRYLVLSDVHANAIALAAVLQDAERRGFDDTLFLGDAVGYYPAAEEAIAILAALKPTVALLGNHDALL